MRCQTISARDRRRMAEIAIKVSSVYESSVLLRRTRRSSFNGRKERQLLPLGDEKEHECHRVKVIKAS